MFSELRPRVIDRARESVRWLALPKVHKLPAGHPFGSRRPWRHMSQRLVGPPAEVCGHPRHGWRVDEFVHVMQSCLLVVGVFCNHRARVGERGGEGSGGSLDRAIVFCSRAMVSWTSDRSAFKLRAVLERGLRS